MNANLEGGLEVHFIEC